MNIFRPVGVVLLAIMPTSTIAWAYRREGVEQPHLHPEQATQFDWRYDQRSSVVSGTMVAMHHWAITVTGQDSASSGSL
jgi:hypothetical protein